MRQRRWLELIKDYDCSINYHPGKANVVADALSRKERLNMIKMAEELAQDLERMEIEVRVPRESQEQLYEVTFQPALMEKIKRCQEGVMEQELDTLIGEELSHNSRFSIHPGSAKMYQDLKRNIWWPGMKKDISNWKWEEIAMDFVVGLPRTRANHDAIWDEVGEKKVLGPELVQQTRDAIVLIRKRLEASQDRQRKYADLHMKYMDFEIGALVLLKVSPWKGLVRFGQKGKLSPRFIGPFEVLKKAEKVAYEIALSPQWQNIHNVFHVSMLKPYIPNSNQVIEYEPIELQPDLSYVEQPNQILDRKERVLRNKSIPIVKVLWRNPRVEESTWELESDMLDKYPHLFS
ncbi:hypothetical protein AgCh_021865 [Apium graveolens]